MVKIVAGVAIMAGVVYVALVWLPDFRADLTNIRTRRAWRDVAGLAPGPAPAPSRRVRRRRVDVAGPEGPRENNTGLVNRHIVRRHARVDANHGEVRSALRAAGWTVVDCARIGSGFPDLIIARRGVIRMVEIKDGAKVPSAQKLTEDEVQFHALMAAAGVTVSVVTSVEEALAL